jgi:tetratricopeptide (TPR) repeat protein
VAAASVKHRLGKIFHATYAQLRPKPTAAERRELMLTLFLLSEDQIHDPAFHTAFVRGRLAIEADPRAAFELLESQGVGKSWLYAEVASHLPARSGSREALSASSEERMDLWLLANTRAVELDPGRRDAMQRLIDANAAMAAKLLEEVTAREGFEASRGSRLNFAEAYLRSAQPEKASGLLAEVLVEDPRDESALEFLMRADPAAAEAHLRVLCAEDGGPWTLSLAGLLAEDGRDQEMVTVLCQGLERRPGDLELVRALGSAAPDQAYDYLLGGRPLAEVDELVAEEFETLASELEGLGDTARQIEALRQVALRRPLTDQGAVDWPQELEDQAPGLLIQALEARWEPDSSLDFLGTLGTVYWRHGYEEEAEVLWRSAREAFPDEEAWQENLDAAEAGTPPPWFWR